MGIGATTRPLQAAAQMIDLSLSEPLIAPLIRADMRQKISVLCALDARLATMAATGKEPVLRQIRLQWWHDQLLATDGGLAASQPLLAQVAATLGGDGGARALAALAAAWSAQAIAGPGEWTGESGAILFQIAANLLGGRSERLALAGQGWAMVRHATDQALPPDDALWARAAAVLQNAPVNHMPRELAALAALTGLARRIARRRGLRSQLAEQGVILRIGLLGR